MKLNPLYFVIFLSLVFVIAGCGADVPEPTAIPTPVPEVDQPEPEPEAEPTETTGSELAATEQENATQNQSIRIGINADLVSPLVVTVRGSLSGFEIELAEEIAARLLGSQAQAEWVPITSPERFSSLADGQIDMLMRSLVHTTSREEQALFSGAYLLAGNGFLVPQSEGYASAVDLDGKTVAVLPQLEEQLNQAAGHLGIAINPVVVENAEELQSKLGFDEVDSIYHDWLFLAFLKSRDHIILADGSQYAPIGIAFPLDNPDLRDNVDAILMEIIADGTWQALFGKWVGSSVLWNIEDMFDTPPLE